MDDRLSVFRVASIIKAVSNSVIKQIAPDAQFFDTEAKVLYF